VTATLVAVLLAAAPFRAADLQVPDAIEQMDVPETMKALGVPVKVRAVRSKQKPDQLIQHFRGAFSKAGLFVPEDGELRSAGNLLQVTGFDMRNNNSVSVILQPNQDGTTTVVVGEAYLHAAQKGSAEVFAPVFPNAEGLIVANLELGQSLAYTANGKSDEVEDFYRSTLTMTGYKEVAAGQFEKKRELLRIWLKPRAEQTGVVIIKSAAR
jgi:hypothetical protein